MRIRRQDTGFIEIKKFIYGHVRGEAICEVVCRVDLQAPPLPIIALDLNAPFIGLADGPLRIEPRIPVDSKDRHRQFKVVLSPERLFEALDAELDRLPFLDDTGFVTLDIQIAAFGRVRPGAPGRPLQLDRRKIPVEVETAAAAVRSTTSVSRRLNAVDLPKLRRADGMFAHNNFVAPVSSGPLPPVTGIDIHGGASQRFRREAMLAFKIDADPDPRRSPEVFVRLKAPGLENGASLRRSLVLCTPTSVPIDATGEQGWELSPPISAQPTPDGEAALVYRLRVEQNYVVCLELATLDFEVEQLLPDQGQALVVGIELLGSLSDAPWERYQLEIRLQPSTEPRLLTSSPQGHRAVAVSMGPGKAEADIGLLPSGQSSESEEAVTVLVRNLSPGVAQFPFVAGETPGQMALARAERRQIILKKVRGIAWLVLAESRIEFEPLGPPEGRIVALDIGTMAMSMAHGSAHDNTTSMVDLGDLVRRRAPGTDRREAEFKELMSAACGVTISEVTLSEPILPTQLEADTRITDWQLSGNHRNDLQRRLSQSGAPLEIHLPLTDRSHESPLRSDIMERGFISVAAVKTQICTYGSLKNLSDFTTYAAQLKPRPDGKLERTWVPVQDIETQALLAAVLDALLFVYGPAGIDETAAARRDWDFILTYPASVGTDARLRYHRALEYVVHGKQRAFDKHRVIVKGRRGRVRFRLVPESVAVCWALLASGKLPWRRDSKHRRLVVFDIGAGTLDVSAFEIQSGEKAEIVCQTVCFSVPLGGDVLDWAIAHDLLAHPVISKHLSGEVTPDLLNRIEAGKRIMSDNACFGSRYLPIPLAPGKHNDRPNDVDEFINWKKPSLKSFSGKARRRIKWAVVDLQDVDQNLNLQSYLMIVSQAIVETTLKAAGHWDPTLIDLEIIVSGRASFFPPLHDAIRKGAAKVASNLKVRLACQVLSGRDLTGGPLRFQPGDFDLMKALVAKGAVAWARNSRDGDGSRTIEQPPRSIYILDTYAVLSGFWDPDSSHFYGVRELTDIRIGSHPVAAEQDLFLATRPPRMSKEQYLEAHELAEHLIVRCLRPIVLVDAPGGMPPGSPVPAPDMASEPGTPLNETRYDETVIRLAKAGERVVLHCKVKDGEIELSATVNGTERDSWRLSSTFMT